MRKLAIILTLLVWGGFLPIRAVETGATQSLRVTPAIVELAAAPGQQAQGSVTLTNTSDQTVTLLANVDWFRPAEPVAQEFHQIYEVSDWFKLSASSFTLGRGEQRKYSFSVKVPATAEPGGRYTTLYFLPKVEVADPSSNQVQQTGRVAVALFLTVKGKVQERLAVSDFKAIPAFQQFGPTAFSANLVNTGNVHLLPRATVAIMNWWGNPVEEITVSPSIILPGTTKAVSTSWQRRLAFGRYTARISTFYGSSSQLANIQTVKFWIIPWTPIFPLGIAVGTGWWYWRIRRSRLKVII